MKVLYVMHTKGGEGVKARQAAPHIAALTLFTHPKKMGRGGVRLIINSLALKLLNK